VKAKRVRKVMLKSNLGEYSEKDQILQFTGNCEIKVEDGPTFTSDQAAMDIKQFDIELSGNVTASNIQPGSQVQITSGHFKLFLKKTGQQNNPYQLEQFKAHTRVVVKDPQGFTIEADNLDYQLGVTHLTSEKSVTIVQQGNMINCKNAVLEGTVLDCIDQVNAKFDQNNVAADRMRLFLEDRDGKAELKRAVISNAKITGQGTFLKAPLVIKEGEELWVKGPKLLVIKTKDAKSYATCEGDMRITPAQVELFKKCELSSPDSTIFADKIVITLKDGNLSKLVMIDRPIIVSADGTTLAPAVAVFEEDILKCTGRPMVYITGTGFTMQANVTTLDSKTGRCTANRTTHRTQIKVSMK
jgi:lipopolysaccharide export system protein LptA